MSQADDLRILPPWREALKRFLEYEFRPGDIITHEWLAEAFGLTLPTPETPYGEAQKFELLYLAQRQKLFDALLCDHQIKLETKPGIGFEYVPPGERTKRSVRDAEASLKKALRQHAKDLTNVPYELLTAEQRQENAEALQKLVARQNMLRNRYPRMLPESKEED